MTICFEAQLIAHWPPLAWVACCQPGRSIRVFHGPMVEVHNEWFGEIIWDGDYGNGDFDRADHAFGSGGRSRQDEFVFVGASSVVDRLQWTQQGEATWVSNTIVGLTQQAGLQTDPRCTRYPAIFKSICEGVREYEKRVPMVGGEVRLSYMTNLHWDGRSLSEHPKRTNEPPLTDFRSYRERLRQTMTRLGDNWSDDRRRRRFAPISTISTGYDSPTATVLGREAGLMEAITVRKGRSGDNDDGSAIAESLGLKIHVIQRDAWKDQPDAEACFIASDAKGEDVYFAGAGRLLHQRVLLTGYGGTRVWGLKPNLSEDFERGDQSGLSHTEARLQHGYIHLPVPFLVARRTADLRRISNSPEMQPWHVADEYNCPLARRIVEEAGVPRELFGMKKKAASVLLFDSDSFLSPKARDDFDRWYTENFRGVIAAKRGAQRFVQNAACRVMGSGQTLAGRLARRSKSSAMARIANSSRLTELAHFQPLYCHLFPWAMESLRSKYEYS